MAAAGKGGAATPPATAKTGGNGDGDTPVQIGAQPEAADQPILKRRIDFVRGELTESRLPDEYEFSFDPNSMIGSWFHRLENDAVVWQGVIIGEPKVGTYLCQIDKLDVGAENVQRLIPLDRMVSDEDGYDWRFYDSQDEARAAYAAWVATERERA